MIEEVRDLKKQIDLFGIHGEIGKTLIDKTAFICVEYGDMLNRVLSDAYENHLFVKRKKSVIDYLWGEVPVRRYGKTIEHLFIALKTSPLRLEFRNRDYSIFEEIWSPYKEQSPKNPFILIHVKGSEEDK